MKATLIVLTGHLKHRSFKTQIGLKNRFYMGSEQMQFKVLISIMLASLLAGCAMDDDVSGVASEPASVAATDANVDTTAVVADGAYSLESVIVTKQGEANSYYRDQMKIYNGNRFMFAFFNDLTNKVDAGAGYAEWSNGVLIETPIANQDGPVEGYRFELAVAATENGYTQSIKGMPSPEGDYDLDEVWTRLSSETSAFDGLWRLEAREINGSAAAESDNFSQMKLIGGRHYIFFQNQSIDGQPTPSYGFGSLDISASGLVIETGRGGSVEGYVGSEQKMVTELLDLDHLKQTFEEEGVQVTHLYIRM